MARTATDRGNALHLYITRHGKAQPESPTGRDEDRPLRKRGERQAHHLVEIFAALDQPPTLVMTSPLKRAIDTAQIILDGLGCELRVEPILGLGHTASDVVEVLEVISRAADHRSIVLVGHNPQLETLVGVLTSGPTGEPIRLRTGECAVVEISTPENPVGTGLLHGLWRDGRDDERMSP